MLTTCGGRKEYTGNQPYALEVPMKKDYEFALLELDAAETARFAADAAYREQVEQIARDLADDTDRTVTVYGADGEELAQVQT